MKRLTAMVLVLAMLLAMGSTAGAELVWDHREVTGHTEIYGDGATYYEPYFDDDPVYHRVVSWINCWCGQCGEEVFREEYEEEPHTFEKRKEESSSAIVTYDYCIRCGIKLNREVTVLGCSHSWDGMQGMYFPQFSYTKQAEWYVYSPYKGSYDHSVKLMWTVTCNTCGESITNVYADYFAAEACTYTDGVCTKCGGMKPGYTPSTPTPTPTPVTPAPATAVPVTEAPVTEAPTTPAPGGCTHETTRTVDDRNWTPLDENKHTMIDMARYCCECGQVNYTREESGTFPHQFVDGACRLCGYEDAMMQGDCQIMGHEWGITYADGLQQLLCARCGEFVTQCNIKSEWWGYYSDIITTTNGNAKKYCELSGYEHIAQATWRVIANQASDQLKEVWFVGKTEVIDAFVNQAEAVYSFVVNDNTIFSQKQEEMWYAVLLELLRTDEKHLSGQGGGSASTYETLERNIELAKSFVDIKGGVSVDTMAEVNSAILKVGEIERDLRALQTKKNVGEYTKQEAADMLNEKLVKANEHLKEKNLQLDSECVTTMVASGLVVMEALLDGTEAASEAKRLREEYELLANNYTEHSETLLAIIYDAEAMGNKELANAARTHLKELSEKYLQKERECASVVIGFLEEAKKSIETINEFGKAAGQSLLKSAGDFVLGAITAPVLGLTGVGATWLQMLTLDDEIYATAEDLMTLSVMSGKLDIVYMSQNESADVATYRLWSALQSMGTEMASDYIEYHSTNLTNEDYLAADLNQLVEWQVNELYDQASVSLAVLGLGETERNTALRMLKQEQKLYDAYVEVRK